ncbi:MAG: 30S ribosomal protein S9 [Oligoflexia bacterium]|nr:30S ribosomal protein S9 [Oligoflexia bacterium]
MAKAKMYDTHAVGKRKTSVARVYLAVGEGKILVNGRDFQNYFNRDSIKYMVTQPLNLLNVRDKYDVVINVAGGGPTGQAGAIRLGISRAITQLDPAARGELKKAGFLTRDARIVERKKYGVRGARRSFQFSKR